MEIFSIYQKQIKRITQKLTREEEIKLFLGIKDRKNYEKIVACNLPIVQCIAKNYIGQGVEYIDLVSAGNVGMLKAIDKFDPNRGFKFISFAVWYIRQSILMAINSTGRIVSIPDLKSQHVSIVRKAIQKIKNKTGEMPSNKELAEVTGFSIEFCEFAQTVKDYAQSTDESTSDENEKGKYIDSLPGDEQEHRDYYLLDRIKEAILSLDPKEQVVIKNRFGFNKDRHDYALIDIGNKYHYTRERIRQIEEIAKKKLAKKLKEFALA